MNKQDIIIGFLTGVAANIAGVMIYVGLFSQAGIDETIDDALRNDYIGKIIAIGAILNFVPFFLFLRKKQHLHARGVLLATIVIAIGIAIQKFL